MQRRRRRSVYSYTVKYRTKSPWHRAGCQSQSDRRDGDGDAGTGSDSHRGRNLESTRDRRSLGRFQHRAGTNRLRVGRFDGNAGAERSPLVCAHVQTHVEPHVSAHVGTHYACLRSARRRRALFSDEPVLYADPQSADRQRE
jgi:hypothetical protein